MLSYIRTLAVCLLFFGLFASAHAQDAQVQGQVLDPSGAGIPKALVRIVDQKTGTEAKTDTNENGQYTVPALSAGAYKIFVQAPGFSAATGDEITLSSGQNAVMDFRLKVGEASADIVVTAQKSEERLQDVPVPVSVIDTQQLAMNGQVLLRDYYSSVPGLSVSPNIEDSQMLSIRGITTGSFSNPTVGVVIDDVPYGFLNSNDIPDFDPGDLARIEVLRGPQGTLYGADSMGGLIKFVTVSPSTEKLTGRVEAGTSSVINGAQPGYSVRALANAPFNNNFAVRFSGFQRQDPGYIDNPTLGIKGINKAETFGGRISALWKPSNTTSLRLSAAYHHADGYLSEVNTPGTLQQDYIAGCGRYDKNIQASSVTFNSKVRNVELMSVTGYTVDQTLGAFDYTPFFSEQTRQYFGVTGSLLDAYGHTPVVAQEVRLSSTVGKRVQWVAGGFYTHESAGSSDTIWATDPLTGKAAGQAWLLLFPSKYQEYAIFGNLTYYFSDRFDVQVGGRESHITNSNPLWTATGPFDTIFYDGQTSPVYTPPAHSTADPFTYLVTPRFRVSSDLMLYARFASGFRPGGPNTGAPGAPPSYSPDKTNDYEAGIKGDFVDHKLLVDGSLYYINWNNLQLSLNLPDGFGYSANGAGAKSEGAELSLGVKPLRGLAIDTWLAYDSAILTQAFPENATVYGAPGNRLPNTPRFSGNVTVDKSVSLGNSVTASVGGGMSYVGSRESIFTGAPGAPAPRQLFPSYVKADLHAGLRYHAWTANAYANNVSDERALINGGIGYIEPSAYVYITPRTVGFTLSRTF